MARRILTKVKEEVPEEEKQQDIPPTNKKASFRSAIKNVGFNLLDCNGIKNNPTKALMAKAGRGEGFSTAGSMVRDYLPVPWLALQYLIGRPGIPVNAIVEFIGGEGVGKSSLMFALMGFWVRNNIPCFYINSEPKALEPYWQDRLVGNDPAISEQVKNAIEYQSINYLDGMDQCLREWVKIKRDDQGIPLDVPLVVVVDSTTKMMNPEEYAASGFLQDGKEDLSSSGVGAISKKPGATAKWLHQWTRVIAPVLEKKNVTVLLVSGQNQDMDSVASPFIPKTAIAKRNKTRPGGTAVNQSAALQFTMTYMSTVTNTNKETLGQEVCLFCEKNSYGPRYREVRYTLKNDIRKNYKDTDTCRQQAIDMDTAFANILAANKVCGVTVNRKKFSSERVRLFDTDASTLVTALSADPLAFKEITATLSIYGYEI